MVDLLLSWSADPSELNSDGKTAAEVVGDSVFPDKPSADDVKRVHELLATERAWRRRGLLLMCLARGRAMRRRGGDWGNGNGEGAEEGNETGEEGGGSDGGGRAVTSFADVGKSAATGKRGKRHRSPTANGRSTAPERAAPVEAAAGVGAGGARRTGATLTASWLSSSS